MKTQDTLRKMIFALLTMLVAWSLFGTSAARSNQNANESKPTKWEYITENVDALSLQAKLLEWSNASWETFSIIPLDSVVETTDKTRVRVEKVQVTARRVTK